MANSLSEGFFRLTYSNPFSVHHAIFPVNYAGTPTPGTEPDVTLKDATSQGAIAAFANFLTVYRPMLDSDVQLGLVEAYAVDPDTEERTFIFGWNAAVVGTAIGSLQKGVMNTLTFKTVGGGVLKLVIMEGNFLTGVLLRPPYEVDSEWANLSAFVCSGESFLIGRDNTYPFAPISLRTKESDVLRKRYQS